MTFGYDEIHGYRTTFTIDEPLLRFWRADMTYGSEPGEFVVMVGPNASVSKGQSFWLK